MKLAVGYLTDDDAVGAVQEDHVVVGVVAKISPAWQLEDQLQYIRVGQQLADRDA